MQENVFRNNKKSDKRKNDYFSLPFVDIYKQKQNIVLKNYILAPGEKILK